MSDSHISMDDLAALANGSIDPMQIGKVSLHLAGCEACRTLAAEILPLDAAAASLIGEATGSDARRPYRYAWLAAAAAVVVVAGAFWWLHGPADASRSHAVVATRPVAAAVPDAIDPPPEWLALQRDRTELRGTAHQGRSHASIVAPDGVIVEELEPLLRWTAPRDAECVVSVFEATRLVATSGALNANQWRVDRALVPGHTYTWQVAIGSGRAPLIIPAPPDPPARFTIVDAAAARRLRALAAKDPANHLSLGIAAARAGLQQRAIEELARVPPGTPAFDAASRLAANIRSWPRGQRM
jgi:hypothetical protein